MLDGLLTTVKPDLLWIDPALAYLGGDMNNQKDVGAFLRNHLAPLLVKHKCAIIIIHHTNKLSNDPEKQLTDFTYMGAGSAEWANWSRAIIGLKKTDVDNLYELIAAKRGARLRWRTADGEGLSMKRYIGHSKRPDTICWVERAISDAEELMANNGKGVEDVLKHVPQSGLVEKKQLRSACQQTGIGKHLFSELVEELVEDDRLIEHQIPRKGTKAAVLLGRKQIEINKAITLDAYEQDSKGFYHLPPMKEVAKK